MAPTGRGYTLIVSRPSQISATISRATYQSTSQDQQHAVEFVPLALR
jgi:hypothetical protein